MIPTEELSADARRTIDKLAAASIDGCETGGILLGHGPDENGVVRITEAGQPGPHAVRRPDYFQRDRKYAQALAAAAWQREQAQWVGEWHTHPMGSPEPSARDLRTYAGHLRDPELGFVVFVAVIVTPAAPDDWSSTNLSTWILSAPASG